MDKEEVEKDHEEAIRESGFAPNDPSDARNIGEWKSRYVECGARKEIIFETLFLLFLFSISLTITFLAWKGSFQSFLALSDLQYITMKQYIYAVCGGLFGGTMFSIKWLYHSVARGIWSLDRRLWRFLTPLVSLGLGFVSFALIKSGLLVIFDANALNTGSKIFSVGFLIGYFSDSAIAKFAEIAQTLFGGTNKRN